MTDAECDVLIVGSGIAGLVAALAARRAGLDALVIEALPRCGGRIAAGDGTLWLPNSPLMIRDRVADSREAALAYLGNFTGEGHIAASASRPEAFVDGVAALVALLEAEGVDLARCDAMPDHYDLLPGGSAIGRAVMPQAFDRKRLGPWRARLQGIMASAQPGGTQRLGRLLAAARRRVTGADVVAGGPALEAHLLHAALGAGARIRTNAVLAELRPDGDGIAGAEVDFDGWRREVRARCGVIVAAGRALGDDPGGGDPGGGAIAAMEAIGASTVPGLPLHRLAARPSEPGVPPACAGTETHLPHLILVDATGRRFINEAAPWSEIGRAAHARQEATKGAPVWAVIEPRRFAARRLAGLPVGRLAREGPGRAMAAREASLDALARRCDIDPGGLEATVNRWNAQCRSGRDDDFGKGASAFSRSHGDSARSANPCMGPIRDGPFLALAMDSVAVAMSGGVVADRAARVLRPDGSAIRGLHAAGGCTAGLAGANAIAPGFEAALAAVFAMIAVRDMVS